ncbi:MAG: polyprenyl synthetase family protein [Deltaproteobacteria bacterium]|nr:MAG: polyprenyl synthetase family protein [Deltaproteobacteria bacterium]
MSAPTNHIADMRRQDRESPGPARGAGPGIDALISRVEALALRLCAGDRLELLGGMAQEHLASGGRRRRARLALAATGVLGGDPRSAVGWAAAVELLHNATLVHDDIQDGDRVRRGRATVWARHGVAQAINVGDLLLMLPFSAVAYVDGDDALRWRLSEALARRAAEIVRGQALDLDLLPSGRLDVDSFDRAIAGKTGALLSLVIEGAALIAERPSATATALGDAFSVLGMIYQLQDDVLDLYGDKGRGARGCDLAEGKVSALVVSHLARCPADRDWLLSLLRAPRSETSTADISDAAMRFHRSGALADVLARIDSLARVFDSDPRLQDEPDLLALGRRFLARVLSNLPPSSRHGESS